MKLILLALTYISLTDVHAQQANKKPVEKKIVVNWQLQITDPDFELKYYKLDDRVFKAFLPKTSWRCNTSATKKHGSIIVKKLMCDYSVEKAGTVTMTASCSPKRPYNEAVLEIYDERKNLNFQIMLNCRVIRQ